MIANCNDVAYHSSEIRGLPSNSAIFYVYENPKLLFPFCATFSPLMNALVYVDIGQGIHKGKKIK